MPDEFGPGASFVDSVYSEAPAAEAPTAPAGSTEASAPAQQPLAPPAPPTEAPGVAPQTAPPVEPPVAEKQPVEAAAEPPASAHLELPAEWQPLQERAALLGGVENVVEVTNWGAMLFGLADLPEGQTPVGHFMTSLYNADSQTYQAIVNDVLSTHEPYLMQKLQEKVLDQAGIPQDRLKEVQDYLRYGAAESVDQYERQVVDQLSADLHAIFREQTPAYRNYLVNQVANGYMPLEVAEQQLRTAKRLAEIEARDAQVVTEAQTRAEQQRQFETQQLVNTTIQKYEENFIQQQAKELQVDAETVRDWLTRTAVELDQLGGQDANHPAAVAWRALNDAAESRNQMKINAAMNRMGIEVQKAFRGLLERRGRKAPAAALPAAPRVPSANQQQFIPDAPPGESGQGASLTGLFFGDSSPESLFS